MLMAHGVDTKMKGVNISKELRAAPVMPLSLEPPTPAAPANRTYSLCDQQEALQQPHETQVTKRTNEQG